MNFASRYISSPTALEPKESKMFINLLCASMNSMQIGGQYNTLIMVVEKFNDLPAWFYYNNPSVRTISIPNPDKDSRMLYINDKYSDLFEN